MKKDENRHEIFGQSEVHLIDDGKNPFSWDNIPHSQSQNSAAPGTKQDRRIVLRNVSPTLVVDS